MSESGLQLAREKMAAADVPQQAIDVFSYYYRQLEDGVTGYILEDSISPLEHPDLLSEVTVSDADGAAALSATVIIKLNGGLGTSMGMAKAKSLLSVREGRSFLDLIVAQVRHARTAYGATLPLMFMNSFRTHDDTLAALARYADLAVDGLDLDFVQSQEPKLTADGSDSGEVAHGSDVGVVPARARRSLHIPGLLRCPRPAALTWATGTPRCPTPTTSAPRRTP